MFSAAGFTQGVTVHLGSTDGALECQWAASGQMLVHGLALDAGALVTARDIVARQNLSGLAVIEEAGTLDVLPYPDSLVNLLVADADAIGARMPPAREIERVLVPGGVAKVKQGGQWRQTVKSWPDSLDDWTHWCYGPEGNAVSHDTAVRPATSLKWIAGMQGQDLRIARGHLVSPLRTAQKGQVEAVELIGRDAFNGVPQWRERTGLVSGDRPHEWALTDGSVIHFPRRSLCYAVATDLQTGAIVREFTNGLQRPLPSATKRIGGRPGMAFQLVCGKSLVQGHGRNVVGLDLTTGERRWRVELEREIGAMVATSDGRRVFVHEVEDWERGWARWGKHKTVAITGLSDGKPAWRNSELAGEEISDLIYDAGALYAFDPTTNLGDDGDADLFKIAADTGKLVWRKKGPKHNYNVFLNNAVVRGDDILSWGSFNNLRRYATADGAESNLTINNYNQRCTRMSATHEWLVFGLTTWVDREFHWTQMAVGRSDCAYPAFLAHGQTFFTYNLACSCVNPLRGIVALVPESNPPAWLDAQRLQVGTTGLVASDVLKRSPGATPTAPDVHKPGGRTNVITAEWKPDALLFYMLEDTTPPVLHDNLTLVADVHRHTLTASREGGAAWTFTAGGRIYGAPVVHDGRCFVASADGWVYCLDARSGARHWRFLAAPGQRKVVAYGQLENTWPIYNVAWHAGTICVAAGRHAELDGGIFLWGLDPASGAVRWRTTLHTPPARYHAGSKPLRNDRNLIREIASVTPINGGLASEGDRLLLISPMLKKSGSSNSKWGYFENPPDQFRGALQARRIEIRPAEWNGRTINPQELVPWEPKKK